MASKKENVAGLAWRHVASPLARAADPLSWLMFIFFCLVLIAAFVLRFFVDGDAHKFYMDNYVAFWYGGWGLLVFSTVGPLFNITRASNEVPLGILIGVGIAHLLAFIFIGILILSKSNNPSAITALLAAAAAAMMVGIGWVVQHQSGAKASRRAHTFGVLMQSRLSKEFQDHVRARISYYHQGRVVDAVDAPLWNKDGLDRQLVDLAAEMGRELSGARNDSKDGIKVAYKEKEDLLRKKHESILGIKYILNFYEFVCAGILLKELDESMLKETLSDIAIGLYKDTKHVRIYAKELQPNAYSNFEKVVEQYWLS